MLRIDRPNDEVTVFACVDHGHEGLESELIEAGYAQDQDVLDTWFSSALWPLSTMGWPDPTAFDDMDGLLDTFNPTSVLCTAREIITLWVSRMVMFNRYFRGGTLPFRDVAIHPMIQDGHGQKMSKSLGNGVDPRDIIRTHSADALRFVMATIATATQDVRLPLDLICPHTGKTFTPEFITTAAGHVVTAPVQSSPDGSGREMATVYGTLSGETEVTDERPMGINSSSKFDLGRNFATKLFNATRFALGRIESPATNVDPSRRWGSSTSGCCTDCTPRSQRSRTHWPSFRCTATPKPSMTWCGGTSATGTWNRSSPPWPTTPPNSRCFDRCWMRFSGSCTRCAPSSPRHSSRMSRTPVRPD